MDVVGYLGQTDLLLEDANGVVVVGTGHYVMSLGDRVMIKELDTTGQKCRVEIAFASALYQCVQEDELCLKFEGSREKLNEYLRQTTVH